MLVSLTPASSPVPSPVPGPTAGPVSGPVPGPASDAGAPVRSIDELGLPDRTEAGRSLARRIIIRALGTYNSLLLEPQRSMLISALTAHAPSRFRDMAGSAYAQGYESVRRVVRQVCIDAEGKQNLGRWSEIPTVPDLLHALALAPNPHSAPESAPASATGSIPGSDRLAETG